MNSIFEAVDRLVEEVFIYMKEHKDASLEDVKKSVLGVAGWSLAMPPPKANDDGRDDGDGDSCSCSGIISVVGTDGKAVNNDGDVSAVAIIRRKRKPKDEKAKETIVSSSIISGEKEPATQCDELEATVQPTPDKEKGEEEDILDIVTPSHKKMSVEEICQPLPACFWRPHQPFGSGFGDLYCTTEEITNWSGGDYIDVILCKNEFGKLEMIGTVFAADLPVLISQSILYGRESNIRQMREFFISKLRRPSSFEYGCELLSMKGIKFGKFRAY